MNQKSLTNILGQSIGESVKNRKICTLPPKTKMEGRFCILEILNIEKHAEDLFNSFSKDTKDYDWTYLHYGGFKSLKEFKKWLYKDCVKNDPLFHTIIDKKQEQFVQDLAWDELKRLNADVEEFLRKHSKDDTKEKEKTEKQLLQEETKNAK